MDTQRKSLFSAMIGNMVEWYDFALYTAATPLVFAPLFFPPGQSSFANQFAAIVVFASGHVMRPAGGVLFGHMGDCRGHLNALRWTLLLIGTVTVLIGLLPTYAQAGVLAPVCLLVMRLVQGLAAGGEWAGSVLVIGGAAPDGRARHVMMALSQSGVALGMVLGTAALWLAQSLPATAFTSWGWRVPFLITLPAVIMGVWLRAGLAVPNATTMAAPGAAPGAGPGRAAGFPFWRLVRTSPGPVLCGIGLRLAENGGVYLITVFGLVYGREQGVPDRLLLAGLTAGLIADGCAMPLFARLVARWGAARIYLGGLVALAVLSVPFFALIRSGTGWGVVAAFVLALGLGHAPTIAVEPLLLERLFPPTVRYTGVAVAHEGGAVLAGGVSPVVAAALYHLAGNVNAVAFYLVGLVACSGLALLACRAPLQE
ncbi:MFS transporter [Acetobacter sp. TBRC 12305]|uniref:MFS transporter n=1 Tax=Acetobacter garciniae TaxID=2817435 RepID=A0A939HNR0_9PROT|nr:MFS transporter [Acetobacter garciniae]MBO1325098.1 MFS transporter [Acetobacter garciniae]MBX0344931.1 MFS transporter [Acetobacter garciniae]